jgi:hypothetical protein
VIAPDIGVVRVDDEAGTAWIRRCRCTGGEARDWTARPRRCRTPGFSLALRTSGDMGVPRLLSRRQDIRFAPTAVSPAGLPQTSYGRGRDRPCGGPRADPSERSYRTRLLPRVRTSNRALGHGRMIRACGSHRVTRRSMRSQCTTASSAYAEHRIMPI